MITQETKPVKTWGGFNLAILKVNLNPLSLLNKFALQIYYQTMRKVNDLFLARGNSRH